MSSKIEPLLTVADLDATPDDGNRYELMEGELFVSRAPSIPHQRIIHNLQMALGLYLASNRLGVLIPGAGLVLSNFDAVIPDLVFVAEERRNEIASGNRMTGAPDIAIEVLSPGVENTQRDFVHKRQLYGKHGVKEYWIVDPENQAVELFRLRERHLERIARLTDKDEITSALLPGFQLNVQRIFEL